MIGDFITKTFSIISRTTFVAVFSRTFETTFVAVFSSMFATVSFAFFASIIYFEFSIHVTQAINVIPSSAYNIDKELIKQEDNFNLPNSIYIVPITMDSDIEVADSDWYEGMFYYQASKLNQGDFLAHYFLTKDGLVLEGNSKGDEQRFNIANNTDKPIVIIYFAQKDQGDFTPDVKATLKNLVLGIANTNAIKMDKVFIRSVELLLKKGEPIFQKFDVFGGNWEVTLNSLIKEIAPSYKPIVKNYNISVEKIDLPTASVPYGTTLEIGITIKNNSNKVLYQGTDYEPLISKLQNDSSKFYINGIWLSQTQSGFMNEGSMIKSMESKKFSIKINVPLYFGEQKETFQLINSLGTPYLGTNFEIAVNVLKPDKPVVEITQTETGQLNVRDGPWYSAPVIYKVTPGQRFFVLDRTDSGYIKLDLGGGKSGWVVARYTKEI